MPAVTRFIDGTGPVWAGSLFPFLFITIACGAVSGFHSLISSGTTPKMLENESQVRMIGYGAMLTESFVAIMAMIGATVLEPGVYFAMNSPAGLIGTTAAQATQVVSGWGFSITPDMISQLAQDRNVEIREDDRIISRIGVNLGDIIVDGNDIYGDGVNIAARLEALAEPGGICISRVVRDQIRDKLPYPFEDMGEQNVKNIARPVRAYAMSANAVASTPLVAAEAQPRPARRSLSPQRVVIAASTVAAIAMGIAAWWARPNRDSPTVSIQAPSATGPQSVPTLANTPAPRLSIVVLPFVNLSNDPEQDYFADGITDDLTIDLSRISDSFVIAATPPLPTRARASM